MSSTAIEENRTGAREAASARVKVLLFLPSVECGRLFESVLRTLLAARHQVLVAFDHQKGGLVQRKTRHFDELRQQYPDFDYRQLSPRNDLWRIPAGAIRRSLDYLRYFGPGYVETDPLRQRARERAPRGFRAFLLLPPFRWGFGRRLIGWLLRRLEAGMPIPRSVKAFIAEHEPGVVVVSPLVEFGSAQGDYIRTAEAARIPSVLVVASEDDLASKGAIRDVPTLTAAWNEIQVDEAVRLHGLPPERVVPVGTARSNGNETPAGPGVVQVIERTAATEVVARRDGRVLRPFLWLLTPLLLVALPLLRPRATARDVIRTTRRLPRRIGKWAKMLRRRRRRKLASKRKATAEQARQEKAARAQAKEEARAEGERSQEVPLASAEEEGRVRTEAERGEQGPAEGKPDKEARDKAKREDRERVQQARRQKQARAGAKRHGRARVEEARQQKAQTRQQKVDARQQKLEARQQKAARAEAKKERKRRGAGAGD